MLRIISNSALRAVKTSAPKASPKAFAFRAFSNDAECEKEKGLLNGIPNVGNAKNYARKMNLRDAGDLLKNKNNVYNSAVEDVHGDTNELKKYLQDAVKRAQAYMKNQEDIWDRDELKDQLNRIIGTEGNFVCLLGGKSTGKSLVLRHFEKKNLTNVFIVNLRGTEKGDILKELLRVLTNRKSYYTELVDSAKNPTVLALKIAGYSEILADFEKILGNEESVESLPSLIMELVKHRGKVTLIIDEANIAFTITDDTTPEKIENLKAALALFTLLTKELLQV
jgi:archaellum biogenesis ATPase FlaH